MLSTKQNLFPSSPFYYRLHHFHSTQKVPEQSSGELNTVSFDPESTTIPVLNKEWGVQEVRVRRKGNGDKDFSPLSDLLGLPCSDCPASLNTCLHVRIFHTWWISHRSWSQNLRAPLHPGTTPGKMNVLAGASEEAFSSSLERSLAWQVLGSHMVRDKPWQRVTRESALLYLQRPQCYICWYSFFWLNCPMHSVICS